MNENRLPDYLGHIQQAATDACSFVEGLSKDDFLIDKRSQQAVIMSLIIVGEAATKVMDRYTEFVNAQSHRSRLLRYQFRCGMGYRTNSIARAVKAIASHPQRRGE